MLAKEAFLNGPFIPMEDGIKPGFSALLAFRVLGIVGNAALLICCPPRSNVPGSILLYSLCCLDLIFFAICSITGFIAIFNNGYAIGEIGCKLQYFLIMGSLGGTVLNITAIAFERHMAVCYKRPLRMRECVALLLFIVGMSIIFGGLVPISPDAEASMDYQRPSFLCSQAWYSNSTFARIITIWSMTILPISISYICYAYLAVYNTFRQAFKAAHQNDSSSPSNTNSKELGVFKTCVVITNVYFFTWTPFSLRIIIEIATGQPVSDSFVAASEIFTMVNSFLDPYILMIFDNRVRGIMTKTALGKAIMGLFEKKPKPKAMQNSKPVQKANQVVIKTASILTQDEKTKIINVSS